MTDALRTPDERFADLPGFTFKPRCVEDLPGYAGLRMHYVDEGPAGAEQTFVCLHGQPTWSYLYRKMIPVFTAAGHRVVAPDFFGFGRSDKPSDEGTYTFAFHLGSVRELMEKLDLSNVTLVVQDWGGILGLLLPMEMPERISRLLVMNTGLMTGDFKMPDFFFGWRQWVKDNPDMDVGRLMKRACPILSDEECAAYDAPFPDVRFKAGVRQFPELVPVAPDDPGAAEARRARDWLKKEWSGSTFLAAGMTDEIFPPVAMKMLARLIRGCPPPYEVAEAGHFVQEWGDGVARAALEAFA